MSADRLCEICGEKAIHWKRCDKHFDCDGCGEGPNDGIRITYYQEGLLCDNCHASALEEKIKNFNEDTSHELVIVCPHCGYRYIDSWEYIRGGDGELECLNCERHFDLEIEHEVRYTTRKTQNKPEELHKSNAV